jgi:glycosyl transferase, family 25
MRKCKIILITLPGSRRHELLAAHLQEKGFSAEVSPAVFLRAEDGLPADYDRTARNRQLGYDLTRGEIGCFLAHRDAWRRVAEADGPCMILEDDARLRPPFSPAALQEVADVIADTNLIIRLFSQRHPPSKTWWRLKSGLSIDRPAKAGYSAVAYVLSQASAAALNAGANRFWQTTDDYMDDEAAHGCPVMQVSPETVWHDDEGRSLIGVRDKPAVSWQVKVRREWLRVGRNIRAALHRMKTDRKLGLR